MYFLMFDFTYNKIYLSAFHLKNIESWHVIYESYIFNW